MDHATHIFWSPVWCSVGEDICEFSSYPNLRLLCSSVFFQACATAIFCFNAISYLLHSSLHLCFWSWIHYRLHFFVNTPMPTSIFLPTEPTTMSATLINSWLIEYYCYAIDPHSYLLIINILTPPLFF